MNTIRNYLDNMFRNLPNTEAVRKAKAELLQMMEDKYEELIREGESKGVERNDKSIATQRPLMMAMLKAYIGLALFGNDAFYDAYLPMDEDLREIINMKL